MPTPDPTDQSRLTSLLQRNLPDATITSHPLGLLLSQTGSTTKLIAFGQANSRPFHLSFTRETYDALFDAAARAHAELVYAEVDALGIKAELLPLTALDIKHPNHKTLVEDRVFDLEEEDYVPAEVVNISRQLANSVEVPAEKWTEFEIQAACVRWFRQTYTDCLMFSVPIESAINDYGRYLQTGLLPGVSDTIILGPNGKSYFVEFKNAEGALRESQAGFQQNCRRLGHKYVVVRSLTDFQNLFKRKRPLRTDSERSLLLQQVC